MPVIVYLKDIAECEKLGKKINKKYEFIVFDANNNDMLSSNLSVLNLIKKTPEKAPQAILTTRTTSFGINFYQKACPVMTEKPDTWEEYQQIVGRSNRIDYTAGKTAALITGRDYMT